MKSFFSSPSKFTTQLLGNPLLANGGRLNPNSSPNLACGNSNSNSNNNSLAVKDNEKDQLNAPKTPLKTRKAFHFPSTEEDSLPLWVKNRKLLTRIFIIWVVLVIFMLLNVFHVIHVIE